MTFNTARNILAIKFYGTEEGKEINRILNEVDENPWQTGIPTEDGIDKDNEYCFALMFFYDKWWLADELFRANFEEGCFETAPKDGLKVLKFKFDEGLMWQKIEPYKEETK